MKDFPYQFLDKGVMTESDQVSLQLLRLLTTKVRCHNQETRIKRCLPSWLYYFWKEKLNISC